MTGPDFRVAFATVQLPACLGGSWDPKALSRICPACYVPAAAGGSSPVPMYQYPDSGAQVHRARGRSGLLSGPRVEATAAAASLRDARPTLPCLRRYLFVSCLGNLGVSGASARCRRVRARIPHHRGLVLATIEGASGSRLSRSCRPWSGVHDARRVCYRRHRVGLRQAH